MQRTELVEMHYFCPVHGATDNAHREQFCLLLSINEKLEKLVSIAEQPCARADLAFRLAQRANDELTRIQRGVNGELVVRIVPCTGGH